MANRNKAKRTRRSVIAAFKRIDIIPFEQADMEIGVVYRYSNWLFTLHADGTLKTDLGGGINRLRKIYNDPSSDNNHWFETGWRKLERTHFVI